MKVIFYINQIFSNELTGQALFERNLMNNLSSELKSLLNMKVIYFTVRSSVNESFFKEVSKDKECIYRLYLNKSGYLGYITHQFKLLFILIYELWRNRKNEVYVYARYSPSMLAPCIIAKMFRHNLTIRTGPALVNLDIHRKTKNIFVRKAVYLSFWLNCKIANSIIVVTSRIRDYIANLYPFAKDKIVIIPNGVDINIIKPVKADRASWGMPQKGFILGFVGYLYEDQGVQTVIQAMAGIRNNKDEVPYLIVIGDGPSLEEWKELVISLGLSAHVIFKGAVPHAEIATIISSCDVMLAPFTKRTFAVTGSSAMKIFEYLACDKPVLASRDGDHLFIENNKVGWLANPDDVADWMNSIEKIMKTRKVDLHGQARLLTVNQYSFESIIKKIINTIIR